MEPSRPVALDYARERASAVRRWFVRTFTIENVFSTFKTLAWVVPLTILIWVYAEREQTWREPDVTIPIGVRSADPSRIVRLQRDSSVRATLIGPRAQVEKVISLLSRQADTPLVQVEADRRLEPGRVWSVEIKRALADHPLFKSMGVSVPDCQPSQLPIFVDELFETPVEVTVPPTLTNLASAAFEPRTVQVRGPASILKDQTRSLRVTAKLAEREELRVPGAHEIAAVPLECSIDDPSVTVQPATVKATIDVNQADVPLTIPSMTVMVTMPGSMLQEYRVEYDNILTNVKVFGSPDKIKMLGDPKFEPKPKARLEITSEDVGKGRIDRKVQFDLPKDVYVSKDDEGRKVTFKLVKQGGGD